MGYQYEKTCVIMIATDALGNEIVIGDWYGYSTSGGLTPVIVGRAKWVTIGDEVGSLYTRKPSMVRLTDCHVKRYLTGSLTDFRKEDKLSDVTIASYMVFPVNIADMPDTSPGNEV